MTETAESRVLGIDPGLRVTGYGLVAKAGAIFRLVEAGTIEGGGQDLPMSTRLQNLFRGMTSLLAEFSPNAVAMEQLYSHYAHPRTAILMGHARGVLSLAAAMHNIAVFDYAATEVKSSLTGNGRAPKAQMQRAIHHALNLDQDPRPADVADALALALCHLHRQIPTVR